MLARVRRALIASAASTGCNLATASLSCRGSVAAFSAALPTGFIRPLSSSSSSPKTKDLESQSASQQQPTEEAVTAIKQQAAGAAGSSSPARRKRHRHRFNNFTEEIPSFQEFQQKQQVRSLYRKFTRLVYKTASGTRTDLQNQIRREFRLPQADSWHIKRSVSEGNRRYKELAAMLGSSVTDSNNTSTSSNGAAKPSSIPASSTAVNWPWNNSSNGAGASCGKPPQRPLPFPPKSNL